MVCLKSSTQGIFAIQMDNVWMPLGEGSDSIPAIICEVNVAGNLRLRDLSDIL